MACRSMCLGVVALSLIVQPAPGGQPEKEKIFGVLYDVSALLGKKVTDVAVGGVGVQVDGETQAIVALVMDTVRPQVWRAKNSPHAIYELHGKKLEIHTTQENHEEIVDLLAALQRLTDLSVVVESGLYEVERGFYEKEIEPRLAKLPGTAPALPVEHELGERLQKKSHLLKSGKAKLDPGKEALFFAVRRVIPYDGPGPGEKKPQLAYAGIAFHGNFIISADRRIVRMKLTQKTTDVLRMTKEEMFDRRAGKRVALAVPELQETSVSAAATVGDGLLVLVPVRCSIPGLQTRKDHLLVMLLRARIYIPEEEALINQR